MMEIFYDSYPEGVWFKSLHSSLVNATLNPFPTSTERKEALQRVLLYDRPDIVLVDNDRPILVLERTVEVPSGHNVGQRFARLVAAAQMQIPVVYFGPYAAYKHGGETRGPRYMNLRLFYALDNLAKIENTAATTINWPVDDHYEIIQRPAIRDKRVKAYMELFFTFYTRYDRSELAQLIANSTFQQEQDTEKTTFVSEKVRKSEQYDSPPGSVLIKPLMSLPELAMERPKNLHAAEVVLYAVGMQHMRSDPYTGTAMLYAYLYCGGMHDRRRNLVLHFPNISTGQWRNAASGRGRKEIRLFKLAADGILFSNGYLPQSEL